METITSTTPKGREGFEISWSDEQNCGKKLLEVLPKGWTISFSWCQILFTDVQYEINFDKKNIDIAYNQNLRYWWNDCMKDIQEKIKQNGNL